MAARKKAVVETENVVSEEMVDASTKRQQRKSW